MKGVITLDILKAVQRMILAVRLECLDVVSAGNRLTIIPDETAERWNKNNCKKIFRLYKDLGKKLPKEIEDFVNE